MTGTLIQPNLHAVLIHFPLALIIVGVLLELLTLVFWNLRKGPVRTAGRWMLVLGILIAIPTLTTGLYALRQTAGAATPTGEAWETVVSSSNWSPQQWDTLRDHLIWMSIGTLLLLVSVVVWISCTDNARRIMYSLGIVVLIVGTSMIAVGGHYGGELVYEFGTGVKLPAAQPPSPDEIAPTAAVVPELNVSYSPLEMHLLFAGIAIALVAISLGLSVRLSNVLWENRFAEEKAIAAGYRPAGRFGQDANLLSIPVIYPGVFWILAILALILTIAMGLTVLGLWRTRRPLVISGGQALPR